MCWLEVVSFDPGLAEDSSALNSIGGHGKLKPLATDSLPVFVVDIAPASVGVHDRAALSPNLAASKPVLNHVPLTQSFLLGLFGVLKAKFDRAG